LDFWFISRETSLLIGVLRDTVFIIGGVLLHDASELPVEGFHSLVAAGYGVFRAAVFVHDFDVRQPIGRRIFHNNVALFIERKLSFGGIVGAWLDLGIRVRIGEIKRTDFTVLLAVIKIIVGKKPRPVPRRVSSMISLSFSFEFTSSSLLRFGSFHKKIQLE